MSTPLTQVHGIGATMSRALAGHGIENAEQLAAAKANDLLAVTGIGASTAPRLIAAAKAAVEAAGLAVLADPPAPPTKKGGKKKDKGKKKAKKAKAKNASDKKTKDKAAGKAKKKSKDKKKSKGKKKTGKKK